MPSLLAGVAGGPLLGILAHVYLTILEHIPATAEILRKSREQMAQVPGIKPAYFVVAVLFATFAEEYRFRGLLYRAREGVLALSNSRSMETKKMTAQDVVLLVRDARSTKHAERTLLWAIALRAKLNPKGCYAEVTYQQLIRDTALSNNTLRCAAKQLEDANLIRRIVRPNLPNVFSINVALLQEQAAAVTAADKEKDKETEHYHDYERYDDYEDDTSPSLPPLPPPRRPAARAYTYPDRGSSSAASS